MLRNFEQSIKNLKKAKELGDNAIDDLIYVYCDRKQKKKWN
jgi:hypothetical protein